MTERGKKVLLAAEVLLLLGPLTLITALFVVLNYSAYPIPNLRPLQIAFDVGMLLQVAGIVAAWYLAVRYLRSGRNGLLQTNRAWTVLLAGGAVVGLLGAAVAGEHALNPRTAADFVGFALFAPAAALAPVFVHLYRRRRHG